MDLTSTALLLAAGIAALLIGGELTVRGASGLSRSFGVSPLFIGLTVVAFGSSAPEFVVNVTGALQDRTELAFGNVIGSNFANIGLVLALATIIASIRIQGQIVTREIPLLVLITFLLVVFGFDSLLSGSDVVDKLDRSEGLALLTLFILFIYINVADIIKERRDDPLLLSIEAHGRTPTAPDSEDRLEKSKRKKNIVLTIIGFASLIVGGQLTIDNASELAIALGVPPVAVGMIIVALGTSLPELVTSVVAAVRGEPDLAVGNIVGSNIFNTVFVLAISAMITPIEIPAGGHYDLLLGFAMVALLVPFSITGRTLVRWEGVALMVFYFSYLIWRFQADLTS